VPKPASIRTPGAPLALVVIDVSVPPSMRRSA
jgi:hypothetical protein